MKMHNVRALDIPYKVTGQDTHANAIPDILAMDSVVLKMMEATAIWFLYSNYCENNMISKLKEFLTNNIITSGILDLE